MEGRRGHLQFHTLSRRFVYRWHLTMQGMRTWQKLSNYRKRSQKRYSINCGQDDHVYKTNIRTFIHSFYTLPWWCVFLKHKIKCLPIFFLHRLNDNTFWVYRKYTWHITILRYGSLVAVLSILFKLWWQAKTARSFFWRCAWFGIQSMNQNAKLNWILITFHVEIVAWMSRV